MESTCTLEPIVARARHLYSLPRVASQVLELTAEPDIDVAALKACIENDPALTVKILKVVNSSLFGFSGEIGDLGQALALIGIKPLKLLVLGFSLPDELFLDIAGDQLERYWTTALVRAVAARELAELMDGHSGDEAFTAGLLQDVGLLVLLRELGEPYARFLKVVWTEEADLLQLEQDALAFDHRQVSSGVLTHWGMPDTLIHAVGGQAGSAEPEDQSPSEDLTRLLHLAELTAALVGQRKLNVLPELLQLGRVYCGLDKPKLNDVVAEVQQKVEGLAETLSLKLPEGLDFTGVLSEAHRLLAEAAEEAVIPLSRIARSEEQQCDELWEQARNLSAAAARFLEDGSQAPQTPSATKQDTGTAVLPRLDELTTQCRLQREPFSLMLVGYQLISRGNGRQSQRDAMSFLSTLEAMCWSLDHPQREVVALGSERFAVLLPACDRLEAVHLGQIVVDSSIQEASEKEIYVEPSALSVGVASVETIPKNFDVKALLESGERCLYAAGLSGGASVKSIEL